VNVSQVPLAQLRPHPRNYRTHPADQLAQIAASLREHGWYRPVVVARGDVILAGHGVVEAARGLGWTQAPVTRLDVDPESVAAMKVLAGDNMMPHLSVDDDRALTEMLREIQEKGNLLGTGLDAAAQLAALAMVTRPAGEVRDKDHALAWLGMPQTENEAALDGSEFRVMVCLDSEARREEFLRLIGSPLVSKRTAAWWALYWPDRPRNVRHPELRALLGEA